MNLIISGSDVLGFCRKSNLPSAYKEILWLVLCDKTPKMLSFCLIAAARGSINKAGDNVPRWSWNGDYIMLFVITDANGVLYNVSIQWIKESPKCCVKKLPTDFIKSLLFLNLY